MFQVLSIRYLIVCRRWWPAVLWWWQSEH